MQLEQALPILRCLADGVNPIDGQVYPDGSLYAEPRVLRALYSAVDLMQRELDREKRKTRLPVNSGKPWLGEEDQALIQEYDSGIPLPEIARRHHRTKSAIVRRLKAVGKLEG